MSGDSQALKPKRRWRKFATGLVVITLVFFGFSAWWNHRWIDQRFIGAWRVTDSKSTYQRIYILKKDGSACWLEREGEGDQWWERGARGSPFRWSIGRDGFQLENFGSGARIGEWLWSLCGLLDRGRLTSPPINRSRSARFEVVTGDQIRLDVTPPGIIKPSIFTLNRIDENDVPTPQP